MTLDYGLQYLQDDAGCTGGSKTPNDQELRKPCKRVHIASHRMQPGPPPHALAGPYVAALHGSLRPGPRRAPSRASAAVVT